MSPTLNDELKLRMPHSSQIEPSRHAAIVSVDMMLQSYRNIASLKERLHFVEQDVKLNILATTKKNVTERMPACENLQENVSNIHVYDNAT